MNYLNTIKTAIIFFPFLALIFTIPYILGQYHKYGSINKLRSVIIYSFILYMITVYFLVILPLPSIEDVMNMESITPRLIPFAFVSDIIRESSFVLSNPSTYLKALAEPCIYTVVFNIFMTIPFGMYLRYYFKCGLKKCLKYSLLLSLFFELTQVTGLYFIYPKAYRVFDIDDLITNTLGGLIGYFLMGKLSNILPSRDEIDACSLIDGKTVSGLRRITLFFLDTFLFFIFLLFSYFFNSHNYMKYIVFFIYYVIIPYLNNGKTIASSFLNVRLEFSKYRLFNLTLRSLFMYFYYYGLFFGAFYLVTIVKDYFALNTLGLVYICLTLFIFFFIFYLVHIIIIIKNRTIYYDNIFELEFISTIE